MLEKWDFVSRNQSKQIISKAFIRYSMAKNLPKKPQVFFIFLLAGRHAFGGMIQTIGLALRGALQQNGKIRAPRSPHPAHRRPPTAADGAWPSQTGAYARCLCQTASPPPRSPEVFSCPVRFDSAWFRHAPFLHRKQAMDSTVSSVTSAYSSSSRWRRLSAVSKGGVKNPFGV